MSRFEASRCVSPPDEELLCPICKNILDSPKQTICQHVFCDGCITRALSISGKCPVCRRQTGVNQLKPVIPLIQNMINKLSLKCDFFDKGCVELIPVQHFPLHHETCKFWRVPCKWCQKPIQRRHLQFHEDVVCDDRKIKCERQCGCEVVWKEKDSHECIAYLGSRIRDLEAKNESLQKELNSLKTPAAPKRGNPNRCFKTRGPFDGNQCPQCSPFHYCSNCSHVSNNGSLYCE